MAKNFYYPYNLTVNRQKRHQLSIGAFKGVDYNPSQLAVSNEHAVEIENIVYRDRILQKRLPFEQLAKLTEKLNGFWRYNDTYFIAHIGTNLYAVKGLGKTKTYHDFEIVGQINDSDEITLNNEKSNAFYSKKALYILDGKKFYVLKTTTIGELELRLVEDDEETYIPTTTIGITYTNFNEKGNNASPLDDVNLVTEWRKNKLVSGLYKDENIEKIEPYWNYELDSCVNAKNEIDLNDIEITISYISPIEEGGE